MITNDIIAYILWKPISKKTEKEIFSIIREVGKAAGENANVVGILPGRTFKTKAYFIIKKRYFRLTFNFRGIPFSLLRVQVDEISRKAHDEGILVEEEKSNTTTQWL